MTEYPEFVNEYYNPEEYNFVMLSPWVVDAINRDVSLFCENYNGTDGNKKLCFEDSIAFINKVGESVEHVYDYECSDDSGCDEKEDVVSLVVEAVEMKLFGDSHWEPESMEESSESYEEPDDE